MFQFEFPAELLQFRLNGPEFVPLFTLFLIQAGLVFELRHIEGVRQAAYIQYQIRLRRQTKLEPEGHDGKPHGAFCTAIFQEKVADAFLVLCSREQCRVDGVIGP